MKHLSRRRKRKQALVTSNFLDPTLMSWCEKLVVARAIPLVAASEQGGAQTWKAEPKKQGLTGVVS